MHHLLVWHLVPLLYFVCWGYTYVVNLRLVLDRSLLATSVVQRISRCMAFARCCEFIWTLGQLTR